MKLKFPLIDIKRKKNGFRIDVSFYDSIKIWQRAKTIKKFRRKSTRIVQSTRAV